jgi:hypothetical protein
MGVSISGLEFFFSESPPAFKTATLAAYLCTTSIGDVMGGLLYGTAAETFSLSQRDILCLCAGLMLAATAICCYFSTFYAYMKDDEEEGKGESSAAGRITRGGATLLINEEEEVGSNDDDDDIELMNVKEGGKKKKMKNGRGLHFGVQQDEEEEDLDEDEDVNASLVNNSLQQHGKHRGEQYII